jgi:hypothetical protein
LATVTVICCDADRWPCPDAETVNVCVPSESVVVSNAFPSPPYTYGARSSVHFWTPSIEKYTKWVEPWT